MKMQCVACGNEFLVAEYKAVSDYEYNTKYAVNFLRCSTCGLLVQDPLPSPKKIFSFYPTSYRSYMYKRKSLFSTLKRLEVRFFAQKISEVIYHNKQAKILELGCGNGLLLVTLKHMGFEQISGNDLSDAARNDLSLQGIRFEKSDIEKHFPYNEKFDLILLHNVFEHLLDPLFVLQQCKKHLSEGGKIVITTPNSDAIVRKIFKQFWNGLHAPRHFFIFSIRSFKILKIRMDFKKLHYISLPDPIQWAISLQNVFQNIRFFRTHVHGGLAWYTIFVGICFIPIALVTNIGTTSASVMYILE